MRKPRFLSQKLSYSANEGMKGSIRQKPWIYGSMDMELTKLTIYLNVWMKALKMMKIYKLVDLKVMILLVEKCKGLEHI